MKGWIQLHRQLRENWIWKDPEKLKWWIDILLEVNHEQTNIPIGFKIFTCERGQSLHSLTWWADRWGVSKTVVSRFFKMLEINNMITHANETVTTRLTVCNYDTYNRKENASETDSTTKNKRNRSAIVPQSETNNNENNDNNEKNIKENNIADIDFLYSLYPSKCPTRNISNNKTQKDKSKIDKLLKSKTKVELTEIFNTYIHECKSKKVYMKNFSTFLNNIPDSQSVKTQSTKNLVDFDKLADDGYGRILSFESRYRVLENYMNSNNTPEIRKVCIPKLLEYGNECKHQIPEIWWHDRFKAYEKEAIEC